MSGQGHPASRLGEIKGLLRKHRVTPSRKLGQNFLVDLRPADDLASAAAGYSEGEAPVALEVGTGLGHLTEMLVLKGFRVVTVELDRRLAKATEERLKRAGLMENVRLVRADAVKKGELAEEVQAALREAKEEDARYVLASNLPYSVAAPVIVWHALHPEVWSGAAVMLQKEMGERLTAGPGSGNWGAIGLLAAVAFEDVRVVKTVRAGAFWPRPRVESTVVAFTPVRGQKTNAGELQAFGDYAKLVFSQRRKTVRRAAAILELDVPDDLDGATRVDAASAEEHLAIFELNRGRMD